MSKTQNTDRMNEQIQIVFGLNLIVFGMIIERK